MVCQDGSGMLALNLRVRLASSPASGFGAVCREKLQPALLVVPSVVPLLPLYQASLWPLLGP